MLKLIECSRFQNLKIMFKKFFENRRQKKENERQALLDEQRAKEMQDRIKTKRTLSSMKKQLEKFEASKNEYIEKAREASIVGNKQTFNLAKSGIKMCLTKQRLLESMIANFELSTQVGDMNKSIQDFVGSMNIISEQMKEVASTMDMTRAQVAYEKAISNNAGQYEALNAYLETMSASVEAFDGVADGISDEEIDKLITHQVLDVESTIDQEIEAKIQDVREKLNA